MSTGMATLKEVKDALGEWIQKYFGVTEDITQFSRPFNHHNCLEVVSRNDSRGYVFAKTLCSESHMIAVRDEYAAMGEKTVLRSFTDFEKNIAGFSWRYNA